MSFQKTRFKLENIVEIKIVIITITGFDENNACWAFRFALQLGVRNFSGYYNILVNNTKLYYAFEINKTMMQFFIDNAKGLSSDPLSVYLKVLVAVKLYSQPLIFFWKHKR